MQAFKLDNWEGRFGNNVVQVLKAVYICLQQNYDVLLFPPHEFFNTTRININNEMGDIFDVISTTDSVYFAKIDYHINPKIVFDKYVAPIININRDMSSTGFIMFSRGEDAFANFAGQITGYVHPPLYYFLKCMQDENIRHKPKMVCKDLLNPVAKYMYENNIVSWSANDYKTDIETMINASTLVFECSTQIYFIILFSKNLKKIYLPRNIYDATKNIFGFAHFDIDSILGDKELIIIDLPNYPNYGEFHHCDETFRMMITYRP